MRYDGNSSYNKELRKILLDYYETIEDTRMVFRIGWLTAKEECIALPPLEPPQKHLLLLCLNSDTFARADTATLQFVCQELELDKEFRQFLDDWNLHELCPAVAKNELIQNAKLLKSIIFISRVFIATKALEQPPSQSLLRDVRKVLEIVNTELTAERDKRRKPCPEALAGQPNRKKRRHSPSSSRRTGSGGKSAVPLALRKSPPPQSTAASMQDKPLACSDVARNLFEEEATASVGTSIQGTHPAGQSTQAEVTNATSSARSDPIKTLLETMVAKERDHHQDRMGKLKQKSRDEDERHRKKKESIVTESTEESLRHQATIKGLQDALGLLNDLERADIGHKKELRAKIENEVKQKMMQLVSTSFGTS